MYGLKDNGPTGHRPWLIPLLCSQVACRRGSPLILGVKEAENEEEGVIVIEHEANGYCSSPTTSYSHPRANAFSELFLASDASAVVEHTKSVIFLEDDDVVHLRRGMFSCYKFPKEKVRECFPFSPRYCHACGARRRNSDYKFLLLFIFFSISLFGVKYVCISMASIIYTSTLCCYKCSGGKKLR